LRTAACNATELRSLTTTTTNVGALSSSYAGNNSNTNSPNKSSGSATTNTPPPPPPYHHRTCRDIRHPISIRNERAAMLLLLQILDRQLAAYPFQLVQDKRDLTDYSAFPLYSNARHARIQVESEQQVLHHFVSWARTALDVLAVIQEEVQDELHGSCSSIHSVEVVAAQATASNCTSSRPYLNRGGVTATVLTGSGGGSIGISNNNSGYEHLIRSMEEANDNSNGDSKGGAVHCTLLRYCADVLGSLRREELKNVRRQRGHSGGRAVTGGGSNVMI
jgi:hypothetical protein